MISRLKPEQFQQCFINWVQSVTERSNEELISMDGKVLRGPYNRENRKSTIYMIGAFATANSVVIGQLKTDAKSNEITAIPELLKLLDIKGCLIAIDAIACQTDIASTIVDEGGAFLLAVKGNQETLFKAVRQALSEKTNSKSEPNKALWLAT